MSWLSKTLNSTIGRKLVMSLTGLFLISFLFVHLIGNFQLFYADGGLAFNKYSKFMSTAGIIRVLEIGLVLGFLAHIFTGWRLTSINKTARPQGYAYELKPTKDVSWFSRNMGLSGSIVLIFLVAHLQNFYWRYHYNEMPFAIYAPASQYDGIKMQMSMDPNFSKSLYKTASDTSAVIKTAEHTVISMKEDKATEIAQNNPSGIEIHKDMYKLVKTVFVEEWWFAVLYVVAMFLLGFHLNHGFQSAFRTLGLEHKKYTPLITSIGLWISVLVPAAFASMPIYFMLKGLM